MHNLIKTLLWTLLLGATVSFGFNYHQDSSLSPQELNLKGAQAFPVLIHEHTMEDSLFGYIEMKIHHTLQECDFKNIWVIGNADRDSIVSKYEKNDKLFNWQRPTAEIRGDDIYIKVFPGREYIKHYATLIATYFAIQNKEWRHVRYILPEEQTAWKALTSSNLSEVPVGDVAIIGWGLEGIIGDQEIQWEGDGAFSWVEKKMGDKHAVFIGGRHSYWGDIGGKIVTILAKKGFKQVIYIGKVGGMNDQGIPNQTLATGNSSFVDGETIRWQNLFDFAKDNESVVFGDHYTIPSVLNETKEWLENNSNYAFVDNEIGFMAKAALSESIQFSYLHIISDSLHRGFEEDLANERSVKTKEHRVMLVEKIKTLINQSLQPEYLYRIVSPEQQEDNPEDENFIHLATAEQINSVIETYWKNKEYLILKIDTRKLRGDLVFEDGYYHLYNGSIPAEAVESFAELSAYHERWKAWILDSASSLVFSSLNALSTG